jgi:urease accessory protein
MKKILALRKSLFLSLVWLALGLVSTQVLAHIDTQTVHEHATWMDGLLHPLTGVDHLAAMVAVGIWGALAVHRLWLAPTVFVVSMGVGIFSGLAGFDHAGIEPMIAVSVLALGLGIGVGRQQALPVWVTLSCVGLFGACHGAAHGLALQGDASLAPVLAMLLSTALLHVCGVWVGLHVLATRMWMRRLSGAAFAVLGLTLLSGWA